MQNYLGHSSSSLIFFSSYSCHQSCETKRSFFWNICWRPDRQCCSLELWEINNSFDLGITGCSLTRTDFTPLGFMALDSCNREPRPLPPPSPTQHRHRHRRVPSSIATSIAATSTIWSFANACSSSPPLSSVKSSSQVQTLPSLTPPLLPRSQLEKRTSQVPAPRITFGRSSNPSHFSAQLAAQKATRGNKQQY